jgi:multiple sugar transport system permease protein
MAEGALTRSGRLARPVRQRRRRMSAHQRWEAFWAYLFLSPSMLGFLVFSLLALIAGMGLSFFTYDFARAPEWAGLTNFRYLFGEDPRIATIMWNTVYYVFGIVLLDMVWAMALAVGLHSRITYGFKLLFRTVYFFPVLVSGAVVAIVWRYLFNMDLGIVNWALGLLDIPKIPWLVSSQWVRPAVIFSTVWNGVGFNTILFLAGLQSIPAELYEAAEIDGAGRLASFRHISLPLLTPTIFFVLVRGLIGAFQLFDQPYMINSGGPGDSSRSLVMYIYEIGFRSYRLGYASAIALALFIVIVVLTVLQFRVGNRWVFYR